jgi:CHAD domain-containing protein
MRTARKTRAAEDLHGWRKQAKYHWYHARLLKPIKPKKIRRRIAQARALTELLGDYHDLVDFRALLASGLLPQDACAAFLAPAAAEMTRLEGAAFDLGRDLFSGKPQAQVGHWHRWWKDW